MADYSEAQKAVASAEPRLGESRWRSTDHALKQLQGIAEKYIDAVRLWRNRAMNLQRELVELKGPCPSDGCVRHLDHKGPHALAEEFDV